MNPQLDPNPSSCYTAETKAAPGAGAGAGQDAGEKEENPACLLHGGYLGVIHP